MKNRPRGFKSAIVLFGVFYYFTAFADITMYARKDNTKVFAEKSTKAETIVMLKEGAAVSVIDGGNQLFKKVRIESGKEGYIPYLNLSEKIDPTLKKIQSMVKGFTKPQELGADAQRGRSANAVMGIRGLTPSEEKEISDISNARPNLKPVFKMESNKVSDKKIQELSESIINELAEQGS